MKTIYVILDDTRRENYNIKTSHFESVEQYNKSDILYTTDLSFADFTKGDIWFVYKDTEYHMLPGYIELKSGKELKYYHKLINLFLSGELDNVLHIEVKNDGQK